MIHELRDEDGNVIHACATASFPLPSDHWIYAEPVEPSPVRDADSELSQELRVKANEALKYSIQVCTSNGKDTDFDPDAMLMTFRNTLFGIGKSVFLVFVLLFTSPCFAQDRYQLNAPGVRYSGYISRYDPPKIYAGDGKYLGELSTDRYARDSVSNPYGQYGSKYSNDSINNPYGNYGRYSTHRIYVYPRGR